MQPIEQALRAAGIDLTPLGIAPGKEKSGYPCAPKGMRVIGWAGVDGIHYGTVRGGRTAIFAVSPMNPPGEWVHPIAHNFTDLLRLLLACGSADALEQIWQWDRAAFERYLRQNPPGEAARRTLDAIAERLKLRPMEDPYGYVRALQAYFDYGRIRLPRETRATPAAQPVKAAPGPWKVYLEAGFGPHTGRDRPGRPLCCERVFRWDGEDWRIPAAYLCAGGVVVDLIKRVPAERARAFLRHWQVSSGTEAALEGDARMRMEAENPFDAHLETEIYINGVRPERMRGWRLGWIPSLEEHASPAMRTALDHYRLDPADGWVIERRAVPWPTKRKPRLHSITVRLAREEILLPGPHFTAEQPGGGLSFRDPDGIRHQLTVTGCIPRTLPALPGGEPLPPYYRELHYTLEPDLPREAISVTDSTPAADGPTAIFVAAQGEEGHVACSTPRHQPDAPADWQIIFHRRSDSSCILELM